MIGSAGSSAASDGRFASQACKSALLRWLSPRYSPLAAMVVSSSFGGPAYGRIGERGMRICVFGAGAIGGNFATRLAAAGNEVSVVARGAHLEAIRAKGLTLLAGDKKVVAPVHASDRPADLGPQDAVLVTMKASGQHALADSIGPLLWPDTPVAFVQNGIPWWYGHGLAASRPPAPDLSRLDPGGALAKAVGLERVVGAVVSSPNHAVAAAHGVMLDDHPDKRYGPTRVYSSHRPSILQDYDLGRPMEIESIVRAPLAFARSAGVETPTLDAIESICVSLAEAKGLYSP